MGLMCNVDDATVTTEECVVEPIAPVMARHSWVPPAPAYVHASPMRVTRPLIAPAPVQLTTAHMPAPVVTKVIEDIPAPAPLTTTYAHAAPTYSVPNYGYNHVGYAPRVAYGAGLGHGYSGYCAPGQVVCDAPGVLPGYGMMRRSNV